MIEHGLPEDRERIVRSLQGYIMKYAQDKFSKLSRDRNGVGIAHMIEHGLPEDRERIVRSLQGDIMKYAQDKFSKLSRDRNGVGIGGQSVTN
uniref:PUM-HD domain-containing protein n=1 Tax=Globodera rostochiensis TaxID=31243 RepID=A0A914I2Y3_GLORO